MPKQELVEDAAERQRARIEHNQRVREILAQNERDRTPAQRWGNQQRHLNMNFEYNKYYNGYKYRPFASIVPTHLRSVYYAPPKPGGGRYADFPTYRPLRNPSADDWPGFKRYTEPEGIVSREKRPPPVSLGEPGWDVGSGKPKRRV